MEWTHDWGSFINLFYKTQMVHRNLTHSWRTFKGSVLVLCLSGASVLGILKDM